MVYPRHLSYTTPKSGVFATKLSGIETLGEKIGGINDFKNSIHNHPFIINFHI